MLRCRFFIMNHALKAWIFLTVLLLFAFNLSAADEKCDQISCLSHGKSLMIYLREMNPKWVDVKPLRGQFVYQLLLDNRVPINTKWISFMTAWNALDDLDKEGVVFQISQQPLKQIFIMKENLSEVDLWAKSIISEDHFFKNDSCFLIYFDFDSGFSPCSKRKVIEWVVLPEDSDDEDHWRF